jgi:hypothetical protein
MTCGHAAMNGVHEMGVERQNDSPGASAMFRGMG